MTAVETCLEEFAELDNEFHDLEQKHKEYVRQVEAAKSVQSKCMSSIAHHRYRLRQIQDSLRRMEKQETAEGLQKMKELKSKIEHRKSQFRDLEDVLPHENGVYLQIILGSVNVSLLSKRDKYKYKEDYERFKFIMSMIILGLALSLFLISSRVSDAAFQFLLVWYYCTLTIREHILKVNGSRIKGWWISHHFVSTVCAGILLIWPSGFTYDAFRKQFIYFSVYIAFVQVVQYYYQTGMLYRLRALGERRNMDISVEGFQSWMWKGLSFVLPFLLCAYLFQFYNSIVLWSLARHPQCTEWQVLVLSLIFFTLFAGNTWTTFAVVRQKLRKEGLLKFPEFNLSNKYRFSGTKA